MQTAHCRLILLVLLATVWVAGCEPEARQATQAARDEVPESQRYGGTAVVASIIDLHTMNSLTTNEINSRLFQRDVLFAPLLRYDAELQPTPWLAERWDTVRVSPDTLELTLRLRRDVKWHDGQPTTADDLLFTYQRVRDSKVGSTLASSFALYSPTAVRVDPYTVRFRLRPHAEFLDGWTVMALLPRHILGDVPPEQLATHPFGISQPVGNGPFRFVRRVPGQEWVFEANPEFPQALGGRPHLDRLVYRVIPDQNTLLAETLTGGVDVYLGVNASHTPQLEGREDVRILSSRSPNWTFIAWNTRLPMFDSPDERRALSMALDRQQIVSALVRQYGDPGRSVVTPSHWAFEEQDSQTALSYSREAARRLLEQAGWVDRDGDGIREDASGRPFRFSLQTPQGNDTRRDLMQIVQAQLRELGVDVRPSTVEGHTLIRKLSGQVNARGERERDFEAVVMALSDNVRKDDSNLFHSRNLHGIMQISGFSHPRVDMLIDTLGLIVDRETARPLWREYQALMAQESPYTVMYYPRRTVAARNRLRGVEVDVRGELVSVTRWWLTPESRQPVPSPQ